MPSVTDKASEKRKKRGGRREEYAEATRAALVESGRRAFASAGYDGASLSDIAADARVTKGALYHHFENKLDLFMAVFGALESELLEKVVADVSKADSAPWAQVDAALWAFVRHSADPEYLQVVLHDGSRLIGLQQQRDIDHSHAAEVIEAFLTALVEAGEIRPLPVPLLARIWLGALREAAQAIAHADDRELAMKQVHGVVWDLLQGLR